MSTTFGPRVTVDGVVEGADDITIRGRCYGEGRTEGRGVIDREAVVHADVAGSTVVVRGTLRGAVDAADCAEIAAASTAAGSIRAGRIILEDGARFDGTIDVGGADA